MKNSTNRREFLQGVAGAGSIAALNAITPPAEAASTSRPVSRTSNTVRIASIQTRKNLQVEGLQVDPFKPDFSMEHLYKWTDGWIAWYESLFEQAAKERCNLVVITEDFTHISPTMMYLDDRSIFQKVVDRQTPVIEERMAAAARKRGMYIVACYFAREESVIYNVADLFGPNGDRVGRYRKVHMPQYEKWQVTPGNVFPAFETDLGWIGMLICYDQMWPESAACCAMNGAQVICQPTAASLKDYHMKARAHDNQVHMISSTGGNSMITSPRAEILATAENQDPGMIWADVDLKNATLSDEYFYEYLYSGIRDHKERHLKFRRPDAYGALTAQRPPLADQYPPDGVAHTPEAEDRVYQIYKKIRQGHLDYQQFNWNW